MGTIKCGFWRTKFFISPDEFKEFLRLCQRNEILFNVPSWGNPLHDLEEVLKEYTFYYQTFTGKNKELESPIYGFTYSLSFPKEKNLFGFFIRSEGVRFPYYRQWAEVEIPYLMLSYQKGCQVNLVDEKGRCFIYEDILKHEPEGYPIYETITNFIKSITKPLRFAAHVVDSFDEIKSSVRISAKAAEDLSNSWIFKMYQLEMRSYIKK